MDYEKVFRDQLHWDVLPLPAHYDPDSYGRSLIAHTIPQGEIVYSTSSSAITKSSSPSN